MADFNGFFLAVRESSTATPEYVEEYAVTRANERSVGKELAQFSIVFNSKNKSFGIALSDTLKAELQLEESYYNLIEETVAESLDLTEAKAEINTYISTQLSDLSDDNVVIPSDSASIMTREEVIALIKSEVIEELTNITEP